MKVISTEEVIRQINLESTVQMLMLLHVELAQTIGADGIPSREFMHKFESTLPGHDHAFSVNTELTHKVPLRGDLRSTLEASAWTMEAYAQAAGYLVGVAVGRLRATGVHEGDAR